MSARGGFTLNDVEDTCSPTAGCARYFLSIQSHSILGGVPHPMPAGHAGEPGRGAGAQLRRLRAHGQRGAHREAFVQQPRDAQGAGSPSIVRMENGTAKAEGTMMLVVSVELGATSLGPLCFHFSQ